MLSISIIVVLVVIFLGLLGISLYSYIKFVKVIDSDDDEVDESLMANLKAKAERFYQKLGPGMAKAKIIISTFQILSVSLQSFEISMPVSYTKFISGLDILSIDMINVMPVGCIKRLNYVDALIIKTLFPPIFVGLLFVCFMTEVGIRSRNLLKKHRNDRLQLKVYLLSLIRSLKFRYASLMLLFSYLYLPGLTVAIFQAFICENVDPGNQTSSSGDYYLVADYSMSCSSPYMKFAKVWASLMILMYPIGVTLLYFWLLYRKRYEIIHRYDKASVMSIGNKETGLKMIKFLYDSYKPQFWYFEIVETSRRLMLTGALSITDAGTSGQVVFGIILAVFYTKVYAYYQPYELDESSTIAELSQYQIFFSFFGSLVVQNELLAPSYNNLVGGLMIVVNLLAALLSIYYEYMRSVKGNPTEPDSSENTDMEITESPNPLLHRIDVNRAPTTMEKIVDKYIDTVACNRNSTDVDNATTDNLDNVII